jgi:hypothetical protein
MAGRPAKLTPELQRKFCQVVASGAYLKAACAFTGITRTSFCRWMRKGREATRGVHHDFHAAVRKAEADAEIRMVAMWQQACPQDWRACRDFLARRFPKRWGAKHEVQVGKDGGPIPITIVEVVRVIPADHADPDRAGASTNGQRGVDRGEGV